MKCDRWLVSHRLGFVLRCLDQREHEVLERHVLGCRKCAHAVRELEREIGWLGMAVRPVNPPPAFRGQALARATGRD